MNENTKRISYTIYNYFYKLSIVKHILVATILRLCILFAFLPLYNMFPPIDVPSALFTTKINLVFTALIIGPIQETFIYLFIPFSILNLFMKDGMMLRIVFVMVSSLIFGLAHYSSYESIIKLIDTFLAGIILAYTYLLYFDKSKKPFWVTAFLHSFINLITILISLIPTI